MVDIILVFFNIFRLVDFPVKDLFDRGGFYHCEPFADSLLLLEVPKQEIPFYGGDFRVLSSFCGFDFKGHSIIKKLAFSTFIFRLEGDKRAGMVASNFKLVCIYLVKQLFHCSGKVVIIYRGVYNFKENYLLFSFAR